MRYERLPFGKHKGQLLTFAVRADPAYMSWLATLREMDTYPGLSVSIKQVLSEVDRSARFRARAGYSLKRMKVVYPRIQKYWMYDLAGFILERATGDTSGSFQDNRLYRFQRYGIEPGDYVYGVRLDGQWFGFAEGTEEAGQAYLKAQNQREERLTANA